MENLTQTDYIGIVAFVLAFVLMVIGTKVLQGGRPFTGAGIAIVGLVSLSVGAFILM